MIRNTVLIGVLVVVAVVVGAGSAGAQSGISLNIGKFYVRGEGSRATGDTLVANLNADRPFQLDFGIDQFNASTVSFEWLYPIGKFLELGAGVGYYQRTTPSFYADLAHPNGADIWQDLRLRMVPITAVVRYVPFGRRTVVQPYIGAGVASILWRYSEVGEFVDENQRIFDGDFVGSGNAFGVVALGGVRFRLGHIPSLGLEARYQRAEGSLGRDFVGSKIDLGGTTLQANFILRF